IRAHEGQEAGALQGASPHHPCIDGLVDRTRRGVVAPEAFEETPSPLRFAPTYRRPRQRRADRTTRGPAQTDYPVVLERTDVEQPGEYAGGKGGVTAAALAGNRDAT